MNVIIAEKPSVAREIAAIVGATVKKDGYIEGNGYAVTWAFGHLVGLAMPESYGFTGFRREHLPILPKDFILTPRQIKEGKEYKPDPGALKQLKTIGELFDRAERIVVATDAGREGELIFRYIYHYMNCRKPFDRLWISSLTDRAIREGLNNLRPGGSYDDLYLSAKARSEADWLVGINASQALALAAGRGSWSLGRVQTPTLAIICSRWLENRAFTPQIYFQLKLHTAKDATVFPALSVGRYDRRDAADGAFAAVMDAGQVRVVKVERREVNQVPPLPYDLTTLQKEANTRHGFPAEKTLSVAQALYEKKLISYPRTGSRYISADVAEEVPQFIAAMRRYPRFAEYAAGMDTSALNTRCVDDGKVTDHHALLPTGNLPGELSADERTIYDMVAGRMLEAFSPVCRKESTVIALHCGGVDFTARGSVILSAGWQGVFGHTDEEKEEDATTLPALTEGDTLPVKGCDVLEKQTKPRPVHTEGSLLAAMETAGRDLSDEDEREAMKMPSKRGQSELARSLPSWRHFCNESGIGTPATRAAIIETLFAREYIRREKKSLVPTDKGLAVYGAVKEKKIADVAMTGGWELALSKIAAGEMDAFTFRQGIEVYASQITRELLSAAIARTDDRASAKCPKCGGTVVFYPRVAKCGNADCGLAVWRTVAQKELTDAQLTALLTDGKTGIIKGFTGKSGKPFEAAVKFDGEFKTAFDFPPRQQARGMRK